jgi:hypothetical protein
MVTRLLAVSDEIKSYRVPKAKLMATPPQAHSADDGHDHSGHDHSSHGAGAHGATPQRALPKVSYTAPDGWREIGAGEARMMGFMISGTNSETAQVAITPLPGMAGRETLIVNMWRQQVGLESLADDQAGKQLADVQIGEATGKMFDMAGKSPSGVVVRIVTAMMHRGEMSWFFKLQGDDRLVTAEKERFVAFLKSVKIEEAAQPAALPAGHPPIAKSMMPGAVTSAQPPKPRAGGPTWKVPTAWKEIDGGQFLFAKFLIAVEGANAAVNVSRSAGDGGGLLANLNRWRGQLGLGAWSEEDLKKNTKEIEVEGGQGTYVEMSGTDMGTERSATTVGVKVSRSGNTWFYKMMGDPKLVDSQKEEFLTFVKGVRY